MRRLTPERITNAGDYTVLSVLNAVISVDHDKVDCLLDYSWHFRFREMVGNTTVPEGRIKIGPKKWRYIRMPRVLCDILDTPDMIVHVRDGDGTNMRMNNLLVTSRSVIEHSKGRVTQMSGIAWNKHTRLWQAYANLASKSLWCGSHVDIQDAVAARDNGLLTLANKYKKQLAIPTAPITRFINEHMKKQ